MTLTGPMPDSAGDFTPAVPTTAQCLHCGNGPVYVRTWESHCGGFEDLRYECQACHFHWWVDGIDS